MKSKTGIIFLGTLSFLLFFSVFAIVGKANTGCPNNCPSGYVCGQDCGCHPPVIVNPETCSISVDGISFQHAYSYYDPNNFCSDDSIRVEASVSLYSNYDQPVTYNLYIDGNFFDSKTVGTQVGSSMITFDKLVSSNNFISGSHTAKVTASVPCNSNVAQRTDYLSIEDCVQRQVCMPGETRNYRCGYQNQVYYEKCNSDGSGWYGFSDYCTDGKSCRYGQCAYTETYSLSASASTPGYSRVGDEVSSTVTLTNSGDAGANPDVQVYACSTDYSCYKMSCSSAYTDPVFLVPRGTTATATCSVRMVDEGNYRIKVVYKDYDGYKTVYSSDFTVGSSQPTPVCTPELTDTYRCSADSWRQQLYKNSDCTGSWVNLEKCDYGCSNDIKCLPNPAITYAQNESKQNWGEKVTGHGVITDNSFSLFVFLVFFLIIILIAALLAIFYYGFSSRGRWNNKPESF